MTHAALSDAADAAVKPLELAIVLPTLNEKANIAPMVSRLEAALGPSGWEAVFVDDNSRDGTAEEARRIGRSDPRVRVIQRIGRRGLASAAIEGMCATAAPFVAVMDADHQHDRQLERLHGGVRGIGKGGVRHVHCLAGYMVNINKTLRAQLSARAALG